MMLNSVEIKKTHENGKPLEVMTNCYENEVTWDCGTYIFSEDVINENKTKHIYIVKGEYLYPTTSTNMKFRRTFKSRIDAIECFNMLKNMEFHHNLTLKKMSKTDIMAKY